MLEAKRTWFVCARMYFSLWECCECMYLHRLQMCYVCKHNFYACMYQQAICLVLVCECVCIYVYACMHVCIHVRVVAPERIPAIFFVYQQMTCTLLSMHACLHVHTFLHTACIHIFTYMYIYIYIHTYMYTHIHEYFDSNHHV